MSSYKRQRRRYYYAVRHGWFRGVFRHRSIALRAIYQHPNPKMQEFFNRRYADDYVYHRPVLDDRCVVYTDGSYRMRHDSAGYGVYFGDFDRRNRSGSIASTTAHPMTSQHAEAYAALVALLITKGPLEIRTDSLQLVYKVTLTRARNCGKLYDYIKQLARNRDIIWTYVPAHSGYDGNTDADELARTGSIPFWATTGKTYRDALVGAPASQDLSETHRLLMSLIPQTFPTAPTVPLVPLVP